MFLVEEFDVRLLIFLTERGVIVKIQVFAQQPVIKNGPAPKKYRIGI
jgi:hypothetical protein